MGTHHYVEENAESRHSSSISRVVSSTSIHVPTSRSWGSEGENNDEEEGEEGSVGKRSWLQTLVAGSF